MATNVRKIRDRDSNFSHETEGLLPFFTTISKNPISYTPRYGHKKEKWIFYSSKHISSHQMATNVRKIRDLGSNFSHKTASFMLASFSTIKKSISLPHQEKKAKHSLTFLLLFSKLLFSFFENNVFT